MKRVLVTGARGFIGRHTLPRLAARGFDVHAVSSRECDLLDPAAAQALLQEVRPSHLLHLAWIAKPGVFWESPLNASWLEASLRLVQDFFALDGKRMVGVGTCAEYAASSSPCRENATPLAPNTAYGRAKVALYEALRAAAPAGSSWAWARLFFPYGAGEPAGRFIPSVIDGLRRRTPVPCSDGRQVRDFVHADDVADALAVLLDAEASGVYNVGSGEGRSLREVAALISAELGHGELVHFGERQRAAHEPAYLVADIARARDELGWGPRLGLAEGIRLTIAAHGGA